MVKHLPIEYLQPGRFQPRKTFAVEALEELTDSIIQHGIIEPIIVRPLKSGIYEIIAGERRWRAAQRAQFDTVPCLVEDYTDQQAAAITLIENLQRANLNAIEEAQAYQNLTTVFGYTHDEIARQLGMARSKVTNALRLLKLDPIIQNAIQTGHLSAGHGKILAGVSGPTQLRLAQTCMTQRWSVHKLEVMAKKQAAIAMTTATQRPNYIALERALSDHIGCSVKLEFNGEEGGKGRLVVDYHNLDILEGIFAKLKFKPNKL